MGFNSGFKGLSEATSTPSTSLQSIICQEYQIIRSYIKCGSDTVFKQRIKKQKYVIMTQITQLKIFQFFPIYHSSTQKIPRCRFPLYTCVNIPKISHIQICRIIFLFPIIVLKFLKEKLYFCLCHFCHEHTSFLQDQY